MFFHGAQQTERLERDFEKTALRRHLLATVGHAYKSHVPDAQRLAKTYDPRS